MLLLLIIGTLLCNLNGSFGASYKQFKSWDLYIYASKTMAERMDNQHKGKHPSSCSEAMHEGDADGIYAIQIPNSSQAPFLVYCKADPDGGAAWTLFQRRSNGSIEFNRNWNDYQLGFGNMEGEHFMGLQKLNLITQSQLHELWVLMVDVNDETTYAKYSSFAIGNEQQDFELNILGKYSGTAGDALALHASRKFSTYDRDNDESAVNCAEKYQGGWWMISCYDSFLNGKFDSATEIWNTRKHDGALKYAHMAIRPVQYE